MELQTFPSEKENPKVIDKILRILIVGFLVMIVILLIDATGILAQLYQNLFDAFPESWILKPIAEWIQELN